MKVALIGGPNSGKGTLSGFLRREFHLPYFSTGAEFRKIAKEGSELGIKARDDYWGPPNHTFVPDNITIPLVGEILGKEKYRSRFLLDGYPRTGPQAKNLDQIANSHIPLFLDVPSETLRERSQNRVICSSDFCDEVYNLKSIPPTIENECDECGSRLREREDDGDIEKRIRVYESTIQGILDNYGSRICRLNGSNSPIEIFLEAKEHLSQNP